MSSSTGPRVALGAWEHSVVIVNLATGRASNRLETTFNAGGSRLALSDELDAVLAAAYHTHGLASYCCKTGQEQWRRKDAKKVQRMSLSADGLTAYCGREDAPSAVVDLRSGETTHTMRPLSASPRGTEQAARRPDDLRLSGHLFWPWSPGVVRSGWSRTMPRYRQRKGTVAVSAESRTSRAASWRSGSRTIRPWCGMAVRRGRRKVPPPVVARQWNCGRHHDPGSAGRLLLWSGRRGRCTI